MRELSKIQSFYEGRTIFITGASGFMGKVLLEKLLFACGDLDKIYILIRPKRGNSAEARLTEMFKLPLFSRLMNRDPSLLNKVIPMEGNVTMERLGLSDEHCRIIAEEVSVVFHCAATVHMNTKLRAAITMNTLAAKRVLELCKTMKHLKVMLHLSTAFCCVDQDKLEDKVYNPNVDPEDIMRLVQWMNEDIIDAITPKLIHPHPNTYTYSKRLAEKLIADEYPNLPCVIARPSIVTPSWAEPMPGWVDNLNGPVGLVVGAGKGVIRSMLCRDDCHVESVPVDLGINALIAIAAEVGSSKEKPKDLPVYNITQSGAKKITWGRVLEIGRETMWESPFENVIWFPDGGVRSNKFIHQLYVFFLHLIPAYFIDFLMLIFHQPRFMVRIQKKVSDGLELLQYFTMREWIFCNENMLALFDELDPKDKEIFPFDFELVNEYDYIRNVMLGARQYCMKESPDSIPRCRRHLRILQVLHRVTIAGFYIGIIYYVASYFSHPK